MEYLNIYFNVTTNDRMMSYWFCLGSYNFKCSDLKARNVDALGDSSQSLHWRCPRCKPINVEFYKFFISYKNEFEQFQKEFSSLQSKLAKFGDLFTNFNKLDNFVNKQNISSPDNVKTRNKSMIPNPPLSSVPNLPVEVDICNTQATFESITTSNDVRYVEHIAPIVVPDGTVSSRSINEPTLRTIAPRKTIFATRFLCDTTVEEVKNYITAKINSKMPENFKVFDSLLV